MRGSVTARVGKRGTLVIPGMLRRQYGLSEGVLVIAEARSDGILIRPAIAIATETYSPERKASFLLENAVDAGDYKAVKASARSMGLDPERILHGRPPAAGKRPKARKNRRG